MKEPSDEPCVASGAHQHRGVVAAAGSSQDDDGNDARAHRRAEALPYSLFRSLPSKDPPSAS